MIWKGREITNLGALVTALEQLDDQREAQEFRVLYNADHPGGDVDLGYATGYMPPEAGARVRKLLNLSHPYIGDLYDHYDGDVPFMALLKLGMYMTGEMIENQGMNAREAAERARERVKTEVPRGDAA